MIWGPHPGINPIKAPKMTEAIPGPAEERKFFKRPWAKNMLEDLKIKSLNVPRLPTEEANAIANHACEKYTIQLALRAHIRHPHTNYDHLLNVYLRQEARKLVRDQVDSIEASWSK